MANTSDIQKVLGYAGKNYGKTTSGKAWTKDGLVNIGVYTSKENFHVSHINGKCCDITAEFENLTGAVQHELSSNTKLHQQVFGL